jgi:hypothetical protein
MNSCLIVLFVFLQKEFPKYFTYRSVKQVGVKLLFSPKLVLPYFELGIFYVHFDVTVVAC